MNFNPLLNKRPYGAAVSGQQITITFSLDISLGIKRFFVVLRKDDEQVRLELKKTNVLHDEAIYEIEFRIDEWGIWFYRFEGETEGGILYFGQGDDGCAISGEWLPEWQLNVIKHEYDTPRFAKGGLIYHLFADRFCRGGNRKLNKRGSFHENWYEAPEVAEDDKEYRADDFFGGDIEGIISKLDYLKSLGVTIIYLSPIFEAASNHRYDTGNYFKIDELFGDEESFKNLIEKCKSLGMEIMLDGVFNHTGSNSIYFNKNGHYDSIGAYQSKDSPYYDWYYFIDYPEEYHSWWGCTVVPTVNKNAPGYREMILGKGGVIEKWTKLGVKGWRLDVVDELPIDFVDDLRKSIKSVDPDCLMLGEVWEDATTKISYDLWRPYFFGDQLDSVTNYPFKRAILKYALNGNVLEFKKNVVSILQNYPKCSLDVLLNMIDSHDTVRALNTLSEYPIEGLTKKERAKVEVCGQYLETAKRRLKLAAVLQYSLPGIPCLYYGDEAGLSGYEDPINRKTYPWGNEDKELLNFYKKLGQIRVDLTEELQGETYFSNDNDILVMKRFAGKKLLTVAVNNSAESKSRKLSYDYIDVFNDIELKKGTVKIPPYSFLILKKK
ncbi:MAG TPA: glycoside hydrolase family 13 protein [Clostridia bacterium]|nr:glycoside hydrolase family 13 protein [Clostridia bacterium]